MRRNAGDFLRNLLVRFNLLEATAAGVGIGLGLAISVTYALGPWIGHPWAMAAIGCLAIAFLGISWNGWDLGRLEKGFKAETRVGQAIESAIAHHGCAFAHNVQKIAKVGDIDHIVATPQRVWVVETKYRKVKPKSRFYDDVLPSIAANAKAVRKWTPRGTPVQGCLVLAYPPPPVKKIYPSCNEKIVVHTPDSLEKTLRKEAQRKQILDKKIATDVWRLGQADASDMN